MTVFLAAVVLILILAGSGHRLGAIRGMVSLAGWDPPDVQASFDTVETPRSPAGRVAPGAHRP